MNDTPAPSVEEVNVETLLTKKVLHNTDQAMERMKSSAGWVAITAEPVSGATEIPNSPPELYTTWEKAVGSIKQVVDVVDNIAEANSLSFYLLGLS
jgi:hypothetical protein